MANILYLGVARVTDKCPIAGYALVDSKEQPKNLLEQKFNRLLSAFHPEKRPRLTITDKDVGHIHFNSDRDILLTVITNPDYPQSLAFKLLSEVRSILQKQMGDEISSSKAFGLSEQVKTVLNDVTAKYQDPVRASKLAKVIVEVEQVKSVMQQNIQAALKNQDNLETLLSSSDNMRNEASSFNRSTSRVKQRMQWKNAKMWLFITLMVVILVAVIVVPIVLHNKRANA